MSTISWLLEHFYVTYESYSHLSVQFSKQGLKDKEAKLYWIENPDFPEDIHNGYIGITYDCIYKRWSEHIQKSVIIDSIARHNTQHKPVIIATGRYEDIAKLERYFRPSINIGWNKARGGGFVGGANSKNLSAGIRNSIKNAKASGELTGPEKAAITRISNNKLLMSNNETTTYDRISVSISKNNYERIINQYPEMLSYVFVFDVSSQSISKISLYEFSKHVVSRARHIMQKLKEHDSIQFYVGSYVGKIASLKELSIQDYNSKFIVSRRNRNKKK